MIKTIFNILLKYRSKFFIVFFIEIIYIFLFRYKGNRFKVTNNKNFTDNIPTPYLFLLKIDKFLNRSDELGLLSRSLNNMNVIKNKKILIIGGTGSLGNALTQRYLKNNKIYCEYIENFNISNFKKSNKINKKNKIFVSFCLGKIRLIDNF